MVDKSEEEAKTRGRPRKYEKVNYSYKIFYYPATPDTVLIWTEFVNLAATLCLKDPKYYSRKDVSSKAGMMLRRMVYDYVISNSENREIKKIAIEQLVHDMNESITRFNKESKSKNKIELISLEAMKKKVS